MRWVPWALLGWLGCVGPPAPDVEVCRDLISRLCLGPICDTTRAVLLVSEGDCRMALLARTGCGDEAFAFAAFDRERALSCREPLLRSSTAVVKSSCQDEAEALARCPDLAVFLTEGQGR